MKITVLTILILMFMAGLAMVQMDANTDNQIQVLSETEMLTTHGGEEINACEERSNVGDGEEGPGADLCDSFGCRNIMEDGVWISYKQGASGYVWCMGLPNANFDCKIWDVPQGTQECALQKQYNGRFCLPWKHREDIWIMINGVTNEPRDKPCVLDENGNLVPVTSS